MRLLLILALVGCSVPETVPEPAKPWVLECVAPYLRAHYATRPDPQYHYGYWTVTLEEPLRLRQKELPTGTEVTITGDCVVYLEVP